MKKKDEGPDRLTLTNVAGGGVERQFQRAIGKVLDSYEKGKEDPKVRKITIVLSVTRDDEVLSIEAEVNTKIPAFRKIQGMAEVGNDGKVVNLTPPKQADLFDGDEAGEDDGVTRLPASR
ncbi:MAG TPA: hypothetical protein PLI83_02740 [Thermomonas sp.]|nr:hypothetical protein [Thermomonas sp.]